MQFSSFSKNRFSETKNSLNIENNGTSISLRMYSINSDSADYKKIDVSAEVIKGEFRANYDFWKSETLALSVDNFENKYFEAIIQNGESYLPYIYEDLRNGNTSLIRALELIMPSEKPYDGYISLSHARRLWLEILKKRLLQ